MNTKSEFNFYDAMKTQQDKSEDNWTLTENGALVYASSGKALVDIDNATTSLRGATKERAYELFAKAYAESPKQATKWLFYLGDIREGKGERRSFNMLMDYMAKKHPAIAKELLPLIPEYARWDYAVRQIMSPNHEVSKAALDMVEKQLKEDIQSEKPSLLAKWLPSIQTKKPQERKIVFKLEKALGIDHKGYRKTLSAIRDKLNIVEKNLSQKTMDQVNMEHLTSHQQLKYKKAFEKWVPQQREEYLEKVQNGEAKINAKVLQPHEIVHSYSNNSYYGQINTTDYSPDLEALWDALPDKINKDDSSIVIRDGSGSMTIPMPKSTATSLDVSTALSIYFAERQSGPMHNKFITFSAKPEIVDMSQCETLKDKLELCYGYNDCSNTNIEKTFNMLLDTLVTNNAKQEDVPKNIVIISDMEFDAAVKNWNIPLFESIKNDWKEHGYELPRMVFWNVNTTRSLSPMIDNERGLITMSGYSTNNLDLLLSGDIDKPEKMLDEILSKQRYDAVEQAYDKGVAIERKQNRAVDVELKINMEDIDIDSMRMEDKTKKFEISENR